MKEMLITGRGGQGVVLASQLLADALARAGYWVQSFPEFKAERRGAPISAFLRWDPESPIHRRYKVHECDVLAVVTAAPPSLQQLHSVRPGGLVVLNRENRYPYAGEFTIARVPASAIARRHGILSPEGRPLANAAVIGACIRHILPGGLGFLEDAIRSRLGALAEPNVLAARAGYDCSRRQHRLASDTPLEPLPPVAATAHHELFPISTTDSLRNQTGSWSEERPALAAACNACALCALFCPEGAITRSDGTMAVDLLYCKGCGICAVVCPVRGAIAMEEVPA